MDAGAQSRRARFGGILAIILDQRQIDRAVGQMARDMRAIAPRLQLLETEDTLVDMFSLLAIRDTLTI